MTASARKFGFELEYASGARGIADALQGVSRPGSDFPLMGMDRAHDYHCRCEQCQFGEREIIDPRNSNRYIRVAPYDLRFQRDSTADGEFITRPINDWDDLRDIARALTDAATHAGATTSARCGLHVHVDTQQSATGEGRMSRQRIVPRSYLAFERYFTEIVAPGTSARKRDMNSTLMEATRQMVSDGWAPATNNPEVWMDMGRERVDEILAATIARDRHVDLNWSRNHHTWEFRVFNSTNAAWRIEMACRIAVAFVEAAPELNNEIETTVKGSKFWPEGCDSPWGEIIRPAFRELPTSHPTKKPIVPIARFIDILCDVDPDLRPLIERQANFMRTRYAREVEVAA